MCSLYNQIYSDIGSMLRLYSNWPVICVILLNIAVPAHAQIVNGSFEENGEASLEGWTFPCFGSSIEEPAPGGGQWSLRLESGNTQGCFRGRATQPVEEILNGEVWKAQVWARLQPNAQFRTLGSLFWEVVSQTGESTIYPSDTTTSREWTLLTVVDTLSFAEGDQVFLTMDAGLQGGPIASWIHFDLVSAEKIEETATNIEDLTHNDLLNVLDIYPNPVVHRASFSFSLMTETGVRLTIHDLLGREIATLLSGYLPAGRHEVDWLPNQLPGGLYLMRLQTNGKIHHKPFVKLHN